MYVAQLVRASDCGSDGCGFEPRRTPQKQMEIKFQLIKVKKVHELVRDDVVDCYTCSEIKEGDCVTLTAPPRDSGNVRVIQTSPVLARVGLDDKTTEILTQSGSIYHIKKL